MTADFVAGLGLVLLLLQVFCALGQPRRRRRVGLRVSRAPGGLQPSRRRWNPPSAVVSVRPEVLLGLAARPQPLLRTLSLEKK